MLSWRASPHVLSSLQLIQNAAARVVFMSRKKAHITPVHQVTLATNSRSHQIQGTDVCLQTTTGAAPIYLNLLVQTYAPPEACILQVNDALWCHPKEVPNHSHDLFLDWCNDLPISIRTAESLAIFKNV